MSEETSDLLSADFGEWSENENADNLDNSNLESDESKQAAVKSESAKQASKEKPSESKTDEPKGRYLDEEEYAAFQAMQQERRLAQIERDFKTRYPNFSVQKVTDKIVEIDNKEKGAAAKYLNEVGFELIWNKYFEGKEESAWGDEFDTARGMSGGESVEDVVKKINNGSATLTEKQDFYKKFF